MTAVSISSIHFHFFKLERLRLIELNLRQNATLLMNSDLNLSKSQFSDLGDEFVDDIIGDDKVNMIIGIFNRKGEVLYKNANAEIFDMPDRITEYQEWEDVEAKEYLIKYLTIKNDKQNRTIRVGMVLNQSLLRWKFLSQRIYIFAAIILMVITLIAFFLTYLLFRPIQVLADDVNELSTLVERGELKGLRTWFERIQEQSTGSDEFHKLTESLNRLAKRISDNQILTQKWSALMAHELKTPMTILRNSIENLLQTSADEKQKSVVEGELQRLETIIMDFLEWASLENDSRTPVIHVLHAGRRTSEIVAQVQESFPEIQIELTLSSDPKIFSNPLHFDQVVTNLLVNALKYGNDEKVEVTVNEKFLSIKDSGPGIPDEVLENFGRPFNKFKQGDEQGHGLGLAWVNTIIKKYNWSIQWKKDSGTEVLVFFPDPE